MPEETETIQGIKELLKEVIREGRIHTETLPEWANKDLEKNKNMEEKKEKKSFAEFIDSIYLNRGNLEHIAYKLKINGSLYSEINRVMEEYKDQEIELRISELEKENQTIVKSLELFEESSKVNAIFREESFREIEKLKLENQRLREEKEFWKRKILNLTNQ